MSDALNNLATTLRAEWLGMVNAAAEIGPDEIPQAATSLAYAAKTGADSVRRKLLAIHYVLSQGLSVPVIVEMGQEAVVASYNRSRREDQLEEKVWLKWKVTGSLRDAMQLEQERISKVLHFVTAEQFFVWLHAQLVNTTDEELRHAAGESLEGR